MKVIALITSFASLIIPCLGFAESQLKSDKQNFLQDSTLLFNGATLPEDVLPEPVDDTVTYNFFLAEIFEYRMEEGADVGQWDVFGWHGGDYNRLWIKSEGNASTENASGEGDFQLLYGRLISHFFDLQMGLRYEQLWSSDKSEQSQTSLAIGFQGFAPYYFDLEPTLFVSQDGNISARVTGTYDILLTQHFILQPRLEGVVAAQENKDFGVGSGLNDIDAGLRLRYEFTRKFAPYVGVNYSRFFGRTLYLARSEGENTNNWALVSGIRFWF
ncbi:MAG TPA: copper resistance protein B [Oligoflexia bacterium]|nr:copper resistance protein B [Oligoflexia bacterium]HMP49512.1 copper resistance protein B [Oligoflexia bacterium]